MCFVDGVFVMSIVPQDEVDRAVELLESFLGLEPGSVYRKTDWYKEERPLESWYEFDGWEYVEGDVPNKAWWRSPFCRLKVFRYDGDVMYVLQFSSDESVAHGFSGTTDDKPSSFEEKFSSRPPLDRWVGEKIEIYEGYNELEKRLGTNIPNNKLFLSRREFKESLMQAVKLDVKTEDNPSLAVHYDCGVLLLFLVGEWIESEWYIHHFEGELDEFGDGVFGEGGFRQPIRIVVDREAVSGFLVPIIRMERDRLDDEIGELKSLEESLDC